LEIIAKAKPDLVVLDLALKTSHGLDLIKDLRIQHPKMQVLVVSMHDESLFAERAFRAGARGYITKQEATRNVVAAIRRVLSGELYLSESLAYKVLSKILPDQSNREAVSIEKLSDRELEVLNLMGRGLTTRDIAQNLSLDLSTIETYRSRIKEKLALADSAELLKFAIDWVRAGGTG
jgi:DNA-binding NarL/FixJ family response regulator